MSNMSATAGAAVGIGNYKGVMLCNRPFAGAAAAGRAAQGAQAQASSFVCGTVPREVGMAPPRLTKEKKASLGVRAKKETALVKHKKWLKELQVTKERLEAEFVEQEEKKKEARERFMKREAKMRKMVREELVDFTAPADVEDKFVLSAQLEKELAEAEEKGMFSAVPETDDDSKADAKLAAEAKDDEAKVEAKAEAKGSTKGKGAKGKARPMWAMTEAEAEAEVERQEDEDADELLDFVDGLDFEAYTRDTEVAALLAGVKSRIKAIEDEGAKQELEELKRLNGEKFRLEERQRAELEVAAKLSEDALNIHNGGVLGGEGDDDTRSVARSVLSESKDIGAVHSAKSLGVLAEKAKERMMYTVPEGEVAWPTEPKIVTHLEAGGSRRDLKDDPSKLPYMHRNPAV